jgi:hypothetical protein
LTGESAWGERSKKIEAAYVNPYEISRIEGPNLVFIPKFEEGGKVLEKDEGARRGRSRK